MVKLLGEQTSRKEIEAVVREADNNGDGTVDFEGETQMGHLSPKTNVELVHDCCPLFTEFVKMMSQK